MQTKENIMVSNIFEDVIYYKAGCSCQSDNHIHTIELSYNEKFKDIDLTLYGNIILDYWDSSWDSDKKWYHKLYLKSYDIWRRIKASVILIFTGSLEGSGSFNFRSEKQIRDYINALEEGINHIKEKDDYN